MSQEQQEPEKEKPEKAPAESDLSQVLSHASELSRAFGPRLGAAILLFGLSRTRYGSFGIAAIVTAMGGVAYNFFIR